MGEGAFGLGSLEDETSEKEVILLGLISEGDIHAYGLEEKIRERQMDMWTTISFSSIYRVLSQLEKKGLIGTRLEHEGQGATRKVHHTTPEGERALAIGVLRHLLSLKPFKNPFSVGLANIHRAPHGEVLKRLENRLRLVEAAQERIQELEGEMMAKIDQAVEDPGDTRARQARLAVRLIFSSALAHVGAERDFMNATIKMVQKEDPQIFSGIQLPATNATSGPEENR